MTRLIPKQKILGMRFGQLLVNALEPYTARHDQLFFLENDDLEQILQDYIGEIRVEPK